MACNLYNNQGFGCGACTHFVKSNSITVSGNNVVINIPVPELTLENGRKICICLAQAIPNGASLSQTVVITVGTGTTRYPLRTRSGNNVRGDQIKSRKVYHTFVAADSGLFVVSACELCKTGYNIGVLNPT